MTTLTSDVYAKDYLKEDYDTILKDLAEQVPHPQPFLFFLSYEWAQ